MDGRETRKVRNELAYLALLDWKGSKASRTLDLIRMDKVDLDGQGFDGGDENRTFDLILDGEMKIGHWIWGR